MRSMFAKVFLGLTLVMAGLVGAATAQQCQRGDADCYIRVLTEQIRVNPDEPENYYDRAIAYRDTKQWALARADLDKYVGFNITNKANLADGYRVLAWVSHKLGDDKAAFTYIDKAFANNSTENEGYYMRGMIYNDQKSYAKAAAELTKYIDANAAKPEFVADGLFQRAFSYNSDGKFDLALGDLNKAISTNANNPAFYTERAYAYRKLGKATLADADEAKAKQLRQ